MEIPEAQDMDFDLVRTFDDEIRNLLLDDRSLLEMLVKVAEDERAQDLSDFRQVLTVSSPERMPFWLRNLDLLIFVAFVILERCGVFDVFDFDYGATKVIIRVLNQSPETSICVEYVQDNWRQLIKYSILCFVIADVNVEDVVEERIQIVWADFGASNLLPLSVILADTERLDEWITVTIIITRRQVPALEHEAAHFGWLVS